MTKAIVTGGAGFIGSHLVEKLVEEGAKVTVIDDLSNGNLSNLKVVRGKISFLKRDVRKGFYLAPQTGFDELYHLICYPRQISFGDPIKDMQVNIGTAIRSLEFARASGAKMLFTSNTGIVSKPDKLPLDEQSPPNPLTPYDCHKLTVEHLLRTYSKYYGVKTVTVRFASVYGPRQRVNKELGWHPVIPEFCSKLLIGEAPTINGDGNQTRDFLNVHDAVRGVIQAMRSDNQKANNGGMFILGTGKETSIGMIFEQIATLLAKPHRFLSDFHVHGPPKPEDITRMLYDYTKAKNTFGFTPQVQLKDGLREVVDWMRTA